MERTTDSNPCISIAFRFHVNCYHSYRGDSLDEKGIGKDIRIIRYILDTLDSLNARGVDIRGTWDIENAFSLERILPQHAPDILKRIQDRVQSGQDEIEPMSYNNGIVSAHNEEEFGYVASQTLSNGAGSGVADLFPRWEPILRPQECMYTPSFLRLYPRHGIDTISLYYSCHPFNGFSSFVPPLPLEQRYNPLWLEAPETEGRMKLLPCYNIGDIMDHLSVKRWAVDLRREQLKQAEPKDLLLLLDMDADDEFWTGYGIPVLSKLYSTAGGLESIANSVAELPYVKFVKPGDYLRTHEPLGTVCLGQDTADGSFDGYSSWTEKWENKLLWTGIERARLLASQARLLGAAGAEAEGLLRESLKGRVLALSTTHFGLASPVMNVERLGQAEGLVHGSTVSAKAALDLAISNRKEETGKISLLFANPVEEARGRGESWLDGPAGGMARLSLPEGWDGEVPAIRDENGTIHPAFVRSVFGKRELCFGLETDKLETAISLERNEKPGAVQDAVEVSSEGMGNSSVSLKLEDGYPSLWFNGRRTTAPGFPRCAVRYGGRLFETASVKISLPQALAGGAAAVCGVSGSALLALDETSKLAWSCQYTILAGLPYVYADVELTLPQTPDQGYARGRAERLGRAWDARWEEILPWELRLGFEAAQDRPFTIRKRNYFGDESGYALDYGQYSGNASLDSCNNHLTAEWLSVSNGEQGLLLSQCASASMSAAFCPMRLERLGGKSRLSLNPFGTYTGKQWSYPTRKTGLGRAAALRMADHLNSYAPSYNGKTVRFSLMLAPFEGERPPRQACRDACLHAYPPLVRAGELPFASVVPQDTEL